MADAGLQRIAEAKRAIAPPRNSSPNLPRSIPLQPGHRGRLGQIYLNWCRMLIASGRSAEADAMAKQAHDVWEQLVGLYPDVPGYGVGLGSAEVLLGRILAAAQKNDEALAMYTRAIDRDRQIQQKIGLLRYIRADLATAYLLRANLLRRMGRNVKRSRILTKGWNSSLSTEPSGHGRDLQSRSADIGGTWPAGTGQPRSSS